METIFIIFGAIVLFTMLFSPSSRTSRNSAGILYNDPPGGDFMFPTSGYSNRISEFEAYHQFRRQQERSQQSMSMMLAIVVLATFIYLLFY